MENTKLRKLIELLNGWDRITVYITKSFVIQLHNRDFVAFLKENNHAHGKIMNRDLFHVLPQLSPFVQDFQKVLSCKKEYVIEDQFDFAGISLNLKIKIRYWEEDNVPGLLIFITDQTEQKKLTRQKEDLIEELKITMEELKFKNDQLGKADQAKNRLLHILGHDFRNIFNAIKGFTDLLKEENKSDEEKKQYVGIISHSTNTGYEMFCSLLNWAKSGNIDPKPEDIYLLKPMNEVTEALDVNVKNKQITLDLKQVSFNLDVLMDSNMLIVVLRNLLSNAIKFTNPGGIIKVYAEKLDGFVKISIEDNGLGIKAQDITTLLEVDGFRSQGTKGEIGTGLGLLTCRSFIEKNGGQLEITSEFGKGSIFSFTVPRRI